MAFLRPIHFEPVDVPSLGTVFQTTFIIALAVFGLFRPAKSQLSWSRTAKLLNELMPSIKAATVERDGVSYPAPAAAWIHGFRLSKEGLFCKGLR